MSALVLFEVEQERFGLPLAAVTGVCRGAWPIRLPRPPFGCMGALDVRGELLPLLDVGALMGLRRTVRPDDWPERLTSAHFLLVRSGEVSLALYVDRVVDVLESGDPFLAGGVAQTGDHRWVVIDPDALVGKGRRRLLTRAAQEAAGAAR